jgi:hypothetical protein
VLTPDQTKIIKQKKSIFASTRECKEDEAVVRIYGQVEEVMVHPLSATREGEVITATFWSLGLYPVTDCWDLAPPPPCFVVHSRTCCTFCHYLSKELEEPLVRSPFYARPKSKFDKKQRDQVEVTAGDNDER